MSQKKILRIKDGLIYSDDWTVLGVLTSNATPEDERVIELGSEAIPAIEKFVEDINSGSFKLRSAVREFEKLIEKYK